TSEALITAVNSQSQVGGGWRPDVFGSICFLVASAFAVIATIDRERRWAPRTRTWWCTWLNMLGSVFFGISAVGAFVIPSTGDLASLFWANAGTFLGALCFLAAALLSRSATPVRSAPQPHP
ncbi:MAG: hypothetical protein ABWX62_10365, partial [Microterricola sp.]